MLLLTWYVTPARSTDVAQLFRCRYPICREVIKKEPRTVSANEVNDNRDRLSVLIDKQVIMVRLPNSYKWCKGTIAKVVSAL